MLSEMREGDPVKSCTRCGSTWTMSRSRRKPAAQYYDKMRSEFPDQRTSDWRMRYAPAR